MTKRKIIIQLLLWAVVAVSGYWGCVSHREGVVLRTRYLAELHAVPCEFRLDATKESHIKVPFHHAFEGLHGMALCIREKAGKTPELEDASFMVFSLLDDGNVVVEGNSKTPCKEIWLEDQASGDKPFAWLCRSSPHIPYKDYILDVEVKAPLSDASFADLPIVVRYNPCVMQRARASLAESVAGVLCCLALALGGGLLCHLAWGRKNPKRRMK